MAPKKEKKAQVHRRQFEKEVRIGIEADEREPLTRELLSALHEIEALEADKKVTVKTFSDKIKEQYERVTELRAQLENGKPEMRKVEETRNFGTNVLTIKDVDSGQVYENRQMTDDDAQIPISDLPNAEESEEAP